MSIISNIIDATREYLRIPSIEVDVKALEVDVKALNESVVAADTNIAKVQAAAHNEQLKFGCMLNELQNSISISNANFEDERCRREDAEKQLLVAITFLTNKINRIEGLADQRNGPASDREER